MALANRDRFVLFVGGDSCSVSSPHSVLWPTWNSDGATHRRARESDVDSNGSSGVAHYLDAVRKSNGNADRFFSTSSWQSVRNMESHGNPDLDSLQSNMGWSAKSDLDWDAEESDVDGPTKSNLDSGGRESDSCSRWIATGITERMGSV